MENIKAKIISIWNRNKKISLPVGNILLAILINLIVEMFSRRSFIEGIVFMFTHPMQFLYGVLIILFTLSFVSLVKRKVFTRTLICGLWLIGGIVNFVVTKFRHTPFTAQDFRLVKYAFKVAPVYLSTFQIILIGILAVLFILLMILWWFKAPKHREKINYFRSLVIILAFWFVVWGSTRLGITFGFLAENFGNIGDAFDEYGFGYCFSSSLLNSGIDKPKNYNEDTIKAILDKIEEFESLRAEEESIFIPEETQETEEEAAEETTAAYEEAGTAETDMAKIEAKFQADKELANEDKRASESFPNIIFVQLESLFDPQLLKDVTFSEKVLPNLSNLYKKYSSGFLSVPSVGAGTANTEFEIISGMNLQDFGPGEYPYKTVLMNNTCESVCYDLKEYGYTTNALHNNDGTFYDRNTVFSQLGFDTFTSIEYMNDVEYNQLGWADDSILTGEIAGIMAASEGRDFIYTISVQGHGDYPVDYELQEGDIAVSGDSIENYKNQFTYYVNQIHQMDAFVGELITELKRSDEPVVLVLYGDHLPAFDIEDEQLEEGNTYTTEYVIWNNIGLEKKNEDIEAFQLSSKVLEMLGYEGGAISKYHRTMRRMESWEEYLSGLKILEYDILYGACDVYEGELPYTSTNIQMGYENINIEIVSSSENHVVIAGNNFTPFSCVMVNGEVVKSIFSSSHILLLDEYSLEDGDTIAVVQKGTDGIVLSSTSMYVYSTRHGAAQ